MRWARVAILATLMVLGIAGTASAMDGFSWNGIAYEDDHCSNSTHKAEVRLYANRDYAGYELTPPGLNPMKGSYILLCSTFDDFCSLARGDVQYFDCTFGHWNDVVTGIKIREREDGWCVRLYKHANTTAGPYITYSSNVSIPDLNSTWDNQWSGLRMVYCGVTEGG